MMMMMIMVMMMPALDYTRCTLHDHPLGLLAPLHRAARRSAVSRSPTLRGVHIRAGTSLAYARAFYG